MLCHHSCQGYPTSTVTIRSYSYYMQTHWTASFLSTPSLHPLLHYRTIQSAQHNPCTISILWPPLLLLWVLGELRSLSYGLGRVYITSRRRWRVQYPKERWGRDQGLVDVPSQNPFCFYALQGPFPSAVCLCFNNYRLTSIGSEVG